MRHVRLITAAVVLLCLTFGAWIATHPSAPDFSQAQCAAEKPAAAHPTPWPSNASVGGGQLVEPLPFALSPEESATFAALRLGDTSYATLERAVALASGLRTPDELERFHQLCARTFARLASDVVGPTPTHRAAQLLVALHKHVLRQADERQPYPSVALERGAYNCVSSTVLYNLFATRLGLKTLAMAEPTHTYSLVELDGRYVEVTSTAALGFGRRLPMRETVGAGWNAPSDGKTPVSNAVLLSFVLEDRLAFQHDDALRERREQDPNWLATTAALGRRIAALSPNDESVARNLVAVLRNLGIVLEKQHRIEESFEVTRLAVEAAHGHPLEGPDARNDLAVATLAAMEQHLDRGDVRGAALLLGDARKSAGCDKPGADCVALESDARELIHERVGKPGMWALAEAAMSLRSWRDADDEHLLLATREEADRLWTYGGPSCADWLLQRVREHRQCDAKANALCRGLARWAAVKWLVRNPSRAAWWARQAW